jgi:glycosyltransferase involved in cell wall biosynthesis
MHGDKQNMGTDGTLSRSEAPFISIVIPTLGREQCLINTIDDLFKQTYSHWECLIVAQGENWEGLTQRLHARFSKQVRVFFLSEANASLARNVGLIEGSGDVVLFLDDDVVIRDLRFLYNHARHFFDRSVSGVAGQIVGASQIVRNDRHWISRLRRNGWLYFPLNFCDSTLVRNGGSGNLSVRRLDAIAIGGMDAHFTKGAHREESDFCLRYTDKYGRMIFDPEASLVHLGEPEGGCRAWGLNSVLHQLHHVAGEWYFILRGLQEHTILLFDIPHHGYMLLRRQIFSWTNIRSPKRLIGALWRCIQGAQVAWRQFRSPNRRIGTVDRSCYREIPRVD